MLPANSTVEPIIFKTTGGPGTMTASNSKTIELMQELEEAQEEVKLTA